MLNCTLFTACKSYFLFRILRVYLLFGYHLGLRLQIPSVPVVSSTPPGTVTWHLTQSASLVSQVLRSSGGSSSLPHNTFWDATFSTSHQMCSSECHVILISKMTLKATANDFHTPQKICIFTDNLLSSLRLHLYLASSNRTQYSYRNSVDSQPVLLWWSICILLLVQTSDGVWKVRSPQKDRAKRSSSCRGDRLWRRLSQNSQPHFQKKVLKATLLSKCTCKNSVFEHGFPKKKFMKIWVGI